MRASVFTILTGAVSIAICNHAAAESYWVQDVNSSTGYANLNEGWVDTNKAYNPLTFLNDTEATAAVFPNNDSNLCWAASAANILQYMMNQKGYPVQYSATYQNATGSDKYVSVVQKRHQYAVYETFTSNFNNVGWTQYDAIAWYSTGAAAYNYNNPSNPLKTDNAGGYYQDICGSTTTAFQNNVLACHYQFKGSGYAGVDVTVSADGLTYEKENGFIIGRPQTVETTYTQLFIEALAAGPIGISVDTRSSGDWDNYGHALTCWGFETDDATGEITMLYLTDSDDGIEHLLQMPVTITEDGYLAFGKDTDAQKVYTYDAEGNRLNSYYNMGDYTGYYLTALDSYNNFFPEYVPEPSTATLSLLTLTGVLLHRRRSVKS